MDLEQLERRKRELELRRDIARLERNERLSTKTAEIASSASGLAEDVSANLSAKRVRIGGWSWVLVVLSTLLGGYLVLGGLVDGPIWIAAIGAVFLVPLYAKLRRQH